VYHRENEFGCVHTTLPYHILPMCLRPDLFSPLIYTHCNSVAHVNLTMSSLDSIPFGILLWGNATMVYVTEPPKIILYYRLSRSTWPLSNNKELFCRFRRVKPGESLTTGSRYALSPHEGARVQHYITLHERFTSSTLLQTRFFYT
jgi:hypothetical protein